MRAAFFALALLAASASRPGAGETAPRRRRHDRSCRRFRTRSCRPTARPSCSCWTGPTGRPTAASATSTASAPMAPARCSSPSASAARSSPRWSPDGRRIAFLARRGDDTHDADLRARRRWRRSAPGDRTIRPRRAISRGRPTAAWCSSRPPTQPSAAAKEKQRLQDDVYAFEETNFEHEHLWVTRSRRQDHADHVRRLLGDRLHAVALRQHRGDDARAVAAARTHAVLRGVGDGRQRRQRAAHRRPTRSSSASRWCRPTAARCSSRRTRTATSSRISTTSCSSRRRRRRRSRAAAGRAVPGDERAVVADGTRVVFVANHGVHTELMQVDVATGRVTALTERRPHVGAWRMHAAHRQARVHAEHGRAPGEIHLLAPGAAMRRVTRVFDHVDRTFAVARQERLHVEGPGRPDRRGAALLPGRTISPGQRYPLLVFTHGGPAASDTFGFAPEAQVYAGKGYAVLRPNYRGSTGYGDAFLRDMVNGYFKQAHLDVLAGADAVIAMGVADPDRLHQEGLERRRAHDQQAGHRSRPASRRRRAAPGPPTGSRCTPRATTARSARRGSAARPWQANAPIDLYWEHSPLRHVANVKTPDPVPGGRGRPARAAAAVGRDVPRAQVQRRADAALGGAAGRPRLDGTAACAVSGAGRAGVVRALVVGRTTAGKRRPRESAPAKDSNSTVRIGL